MENSGLMNTVGKKLIAVNSDAVKSDAVSSRVVSSDVVSSGVANSDLKSFESLIIPMAVWEDSLYRVFEEFEDQGFAWKLKLYVGEVFVELVKSGNGKWC